MVHVEEAGNVLVLDKSLFADPQFVKDVFTTLSPSQILFLLSHFQTSPLSPGKADEETEKKMKWMGDVETLNVSSLLLKTAFFKYSPPK